VLTEGVAVAPDGMVYFRRHHLLARLAEGKGRHRRPRPHLGSSIRTRKKRTIFRSPSGIVERLDSLNAEGNLLAAEGSTSEAAASTRTDMKTGKATIIAGHVRGKPFNSPNDITIDEKGPHLFQRSALPRDTSRIEQPVQAVYRIDPDGKIHAFITAPASATASRLAGTRNRCTCQQRQRQHRIGRVPEKALCTRTDGAAAYDLAEDGTAKVRKVLVDYAPQDGPDGAGRR